MQFVHGGDWAGYRAEFGRDPLDFSAYFRSVVFRVGFEFAFMC